MTDPAALAKHLEAFERELLEPATRRDRGRLTHLLAPEFREFGRSGRVFDLASILNALEEEIPAKITLSDFRCDLIAPACALVTYRSHRESAEAGASANRSSLWVCRGDSWQMIFHQGTPAVEAG